jgi:hypothetical protein
MLLSKLMLLVEAGTTAGQAKLPSKSISWNCSRVAQSGMNQKEALSI